MSGNLADLMEVARQRMPAPGGPCPPWCCHHEPGAHPDVVWHCAEPAVVGAVSVLPVQFDVSGECLEGPEPADVHLEVRGGYALLTPSQVETLIGALSSTLAAVRGAA